MNAILPPTEQWFPIGTTFKSYGKHPLECTITDIWKTYNAAGELVRLRYVATHRYLGQTVTNYDVCHTTVARQLIKLP